VVFLISLIHDVFPDGLADRGIEELFFNRRMNLEFRECLLYDLLLCRSTLGFLESVKQILDRIVILFQEGESGFVVRKSNIVYVPFRIEAYCRTWSAASLPLHSLAVPHGVACAAPMKTGLCKIIQTAADLLAPEPQELAPALASR
jgi:hypothetical protein